MLRMILGVVIGALVGFGYYKLIGCAGGTCPITSNPWASAIYGAVLGFMVASMSGGN